MNIKVYFLTINPAEESKGFVVLDDFASFRISVIQDKDTKKLLVQKPEQIFIYEHRYPYFIAIVLKEFLKQLVQT